MRSLPIELRLGHEAGEATIRELAPDVVIAAVGAARDRPPIPGADRPHVFDGDDLRDLLTGRADARSLAALSLPARAALRAGRWLGITNDPSKLRRASLAYMPVGKRLAIIGGGLVGIELAEFLSERGRSVVVFEEGPVMAIEMAHPRRWRVLHDLRRAGVRLVTGACVLEIGPEALRFRVDDEEGESAAETVVIATGLRANPEAIAQLGTAGVPVVPIGDGNGVGYIEGAIHQGFHAALDL